MFSTGVTIKYPVMTNSFSQNQVLLISQL